MATTVIDIWLNVCYFICAHKKNNKISQGWQHVKYDLNLERSWLTSSFKFQTFRTPVANSNVTRAALYKYKIKKKIKFNRLNT